MTQRNAMLENSEDILSIRLKGLARDLMVNLVRHLAFQSGVFVQVPEQLDVAVTTAVEMRSAALMKLINTDRNTPLWSLSLLVTKARLLFVFTCRDRNVEK